MNVVKPVSQNHQSRRYQVPKLKSTSSSLQRILHFAIYITFAIPLIYNAPIGNFILKLYSFDIPLLALLFLWFGELSLRKSHLRVSFIDLIFVIFLFWLIVTAIAGLDPYRSLSEIMLWVRVYLIYLYFYNKSLKENELTRIIIFLLGIQIPVALIQFLTQSDVGQINQYFGTKETITVAYWFDNLIIVKRAQGTFPNSNILAQWLIFLLPFIQTKIDNRSSVKVSRKIFSIGWIGGVVALVLTLSRAGAFIGIVVAFIGQIFNRSKRYFFRRLFSILIVLSVVLFVSELIFSGIFPLIVRFSNLDDPTRQIFLDYSIKLAIQHPFLGVGYGNFTLGLPRALSRLLSSPYAGLHNIPMKIVSETGFLGGGLFVILLIAFFRRLKYLADREEPNALVNGMLVAFLSCLLAIQVYLTFLHPSVLALFFALMGSACGQNPKKAHILPHQSNIPL